MSLLRHVPALTAKPEIFTLLTTSLEVTEKDVGRWLMTLKSQLKKQQEEGNARQKFSCNKTWSRSKFNQENAKL